MLAVPLPPEDIRFSYAMAYYARGVAHAAKGQWPEAQAALDTVTAINAATPEGADGKTALSIAVHALSGEIATRRGDLEAGINHFREAAKIEDAGLYFEPPKWYYPIRHSLGAALREGGTKCRGGEGVSRGPSALPRERLVPVRARPGAPGAEEERRSGRSGSALPPSVGEHGRDADGIEVLAN